MHWFYFQALVLFCGCLNKNIPVGSLIPDYLVYGRCRNKFRLKSSGVKHD
jgi:hypothetical protein